MSDEKNLISLGQFELVGKNLGREKATVELVFHPKSFKPSTLDTLRFDNGPRSSIVINDRKLAKSVHGEEVFEILLRRVSE